MTGHLCRPNCALCAEHTRLQLVADTLEGADRSHVTTRSGRALVAAIHAAEDSMRGVPGYRSGVRCTGTDHHLHPGNRAA